MIRIRKRRDDAYGLGFLTLQFSPRFRPIGVVYEFTYGTLGASSLIKSPIKTEPSFALTYAWSSFSSPFLLFLSDRVSIFRVLWENITVTTQQLKLGSRSQRHRRRRGAFPRRNVSSRQGGLLLGRRWGSRFLPHDRRDLFGRGRRDDRSAGRRRRGRGVETRDPPL